MSSLGLRWALTGVFAALGGYCLLRCALPVLGYGRHRWSSRVADATHIAMSAAMVAMLWALTSHDRWGIQMTVFAAATAWFLVRAVSGRQNRHERIALVHQGVAMGAMFWMFLASSGLFATSQMEMPGMSMPESTIADSPTGHAITIGFVTYLAVAALWWLRTGLRLIPVSGGRMAFARPAVAGSTAAPASVSTSGGKGGPVPRIFGPAGQAGCQMLMAAGMCLALLTPM